MIRQLLTFFYFRAVGASAVLIGILALWIMAAELISPPMIYFPSNRAEAAALYALRGPAATAAGVGIVRGDLWTAAVISRAALLLFGATGNSPEQVSQFEIKNMRAIAVRAARLSPHDSRIWLVLASLDVHLGGNNPKIAQFLKLSYYTAPDALSFMPVRLLLAVQCNAISDEELQGLAELDIRHIVAQRPDLRPAIALAYKTALPKGREVIEATLEEADPKFLAKITKPSPTR